MRAWPAPKQQPCPKRQMFSQGKHPSFEDMEADEAAEMDRMPEPGLTEMHQAIDSHEGDVMEDANVSDPGDVEGADVPGQAANVSDPGDLEGADMPDPGDLQGADVPGQRPVEGIDEDAPGQRPQDMQADRPGPRPGSMQEDGERRLDRSTPRADVAMSFFRERVARALDHSWGLSRSNAKVAAWNKTVLLRNLSKINTMWFSPATVKYWSIQ
jgi:hypothetical protein